MKIEVTVFGKPYRSHPVGATLYLTPVEAKVLTMLGLVTYTKDEVTVEVPRRRTYRTREMKAE
jgi:hypothetical protein